ncbi:hypothetical protein GY45DRAFT_598952 [Cubamyces sp. BRFM 1775]|nr:hypothetical protein GY45DRAFT_598952 [Cubamyces sp. BRFM 1775]
MTGDDRAADAVQRVRAGLCQTGAPSPVDPHTDSAADVSFSSPVFLFVSSPVPTLLSLHPRPHAPLSSPFTLPPTVCPYRELHRCPRPIGTLFPLCIVWTRRLAPCACLLCRWHGDVCVCAWVRPSAVRLPPSCAWPSLDRSSFWPRLRSRSGRGTAQAPAGGTARAEAAARAGRRATAAARTTTPTTPPPTTGAPARAAATAPATTTTRTAPSRTGAASSAMAAGTSSSPHRTSLFLPPGNWCVQAFTPPHVPRSVRRACPRPRPPRISHTFRLHPVSLVSRPHSPLSPTIVVFCPCPFLCLPFSKVPFIRCGIRSVTYIRIPISYLFSVYAPVPVPRPPSPHHQD